MSNCTCTIGKEKNERCLVHGIIKNSDVGDEVVRVYLEDDLKFLKEQTPEEKIKELEEIIIQKDNTIKQLIKQLLGHLPSVNHGNY